MCVCGGGGLGGGCAELALPLQAPVPTSGWAAVLWAEPGKGLSGLLRGPVALVVTSNALPLSG